MIYLHWLIALALLFMVWERCFPWRGRQRTVRPGFLKDLFYLAFNGHFFGLLLGYLTVSLSQPLVASSAGLKGVHLGLMTAQPFWVQLLTALVVMDFVQYGIHNLLHRVPFLWVFHRIHHSIEVMDWVGNWRFHWIEGIVYKSLSYVPLALLGFSAETMGWFAVVGTFMGNFNHANINVNLGPLGFIFNSPRMHLWHHTHPESGPVNRNMGVIFSLWDWIFGTAYMPDHSPSRLGFVGMETVPPTFWQQLFYPLTQFRRPTI